jgi:cbb3-type cytochrome oxidase maturation protein
MPTVILIFFESKQICIMGIIYIMLIASLVLALFFLLAFLWAIKNGQFEDDTTPSIRILYENELEINDNKQIEDGNRKI